MLKEAVDQFNILVADDEDIVQSLVRDALEVEGYQVQTASNGFDALEIIKANKIDLLIADIRMPKMTGIELADLAREINPAIAVVFMTGYASLTSAKDAIKSGASDYIMKPFELTEIRQAVHNAAVRLREIEASNPDDQLTSLSDLSHVLFAGGDRKSLVKSSLEFALIQLRSYSGSILYWDNEAEQYLMLSMTSGAVEERAVGAEPLRAMALDGTLLPFQEPAVAGPLEDHPVYKIQPDADLAPLLIPAWHQADQPMLVAPIFRGASFHGIITLALEPDTVRVKGIDQRLLSMAASQLAITLENLSLLEETQQAYARLKELQYRTIELEKMAARGELSAEIGHELNNFLGVVVGNVSLLGVHLKKKNYDRLDKYLDGAMTTLKKIESFTNNLMNLQTTSSQQEVISFDSLIAEVVEFLRPQKRFHSVEIVMPETIETISLKGDVIQVQQLLYNLFHNAADASEGRESRRIEVSVVKRPEKANFEIAIKDNGSGFDPELLAKAFQEKFTTKKSGHGFGLMVCKRIVDNHNGELQVESSPGEGTRIAITFPLATAAEPVLS